MSRPYLNANIIPVKVPKEHANGEHISKIKVPFGCIFHNGKRTTPRLGLVINGGWRRDGLGEGDYYELHILDNQADSKVGSLVGIEHSLQNMIKEYHLSVIKLDIKGYQLVH